jgi:septum site-determining protein MinC
MNAIAKAPRQSFRMRGRSFVALAFCPVVPIVGWLEEIDGTLARSPGFFAGKPVVLDLSAVNLSQPAIAHLIKSLEQGVDAAQLTTRMPPLLTGGPDCLLVQNEPKKPETKPKPISLLLDSPVRSGRSIFSEGDVTVLGSVASGAEIVAGGSIHVYGALRGRAMAGSSGNAAARIFCQKIEAELLAINGYYQTAEEIDVALRNRPAQALEGSIIKITPLS